MGPVGGRPFPRSTDSTKSAVWNSANGMPGVPGGSWVGSWGVLKVSRRFYTRKIHGHLSKSMEIMLVFRPAPYVKSVKRAFYPKSAAEMCGILKVTILGSPRTLGGDSSSPGPPRDFNL
jgi:hypothetical protein